MFFLVYKEIVLFVCLYYDDLYKNYDLQFLVDMFQPEQVPELHPVINNFLNLFRVVSLYRY